MASRIGECCVAGDGFCDPVPWPRIRIVFDSGFASGGGAADRESLLLFVGFVVILTAGTFVRFYFVSWVGERVSNDIRQAVFNHLIHMHPGFF